MSSSPSASQTILDLMELSVSPAKDPRRIVACYAMLWDPWGRYNCIEGQT
ncbi:putative formin-like protein 5 [Iris pallida]|uniref:Formin-like protein 5 n=1 Tax=Iris pallida TaxID=29817 RepID=A0AAX6HUZ2_IRIPA|nr:putative formin-like protein 5 [Iris pallida]